MRLITLTNRIRSGWLTVLAAATVLVLAMLATPGNAQTVPAAPASPVPAPSADLAKVHLTAARNALSDVTQLPAAAQLTGDSRTRVQQLITSFNELIAKSADWQGPYAKVDATLSTLLGSETTPPATSTPGTVGTSGAAPVDPAIRAKLVEFRTHLDMFKTEALKTTASANVPAAAPPTGEPPAATPASPGPPVPPPASPDRSPDALVSASGDAENVSGMSRDLLLHVEALEVILGAQTRVQKEATAAAGGAVVSSETPSGSTRTTVTGPDVTLNGPQLEQIRNHLAEMRRLLEKK